MGDDLCVPMEWKQNDHKDDQKATEEKHRTKADSSDFIGPVLTEQAFIRALLTIGQDQRLIQKLLAGV